MRRDSTFARAAAVLVALMICLLAPMSAYAVQQKDKAETELPGENEYADVQYGALLLLNQWLDDAEALNTMEDTLTACGLTADMIAAITAAVPGTTQSYMFMTYDANTVIVGDTSAPAETTDAEPSEAADTADESEFQPPFYVSAKHIDVPEGAVDGVIAFDVAAQHVDMYAADAFELTTLLTSDVKNADTMLEIVRNDDAAPVHVYEYVEPTPEPTAEPTPEPTEEPTAEPTAEPTEEPTAEPTAEPTEEPTAEPTAEPTEAPTEAPTAEPTEEPTAEPTEEPTVEPTAEPTEKPTAEPTEEPTAALQKPASYLLSTENGLTIIAVPATESDAQADGVFTADDISQMLQNVGYTLNQIDAALTALLPEGVTDYNWAVYAPAVAESDGTLSVEPAAYDVIAAAGLAGGVVTGSDVEAILPTLAPSNAPTEVVTDAPTEAVTDAPTETATDEPTAAPTIIPTEEPSANAADSATEAPTEEATAAPEM
ncbi:MAG: hypothetical protein ACLTAO_08720, partial [Christensenellales bacterium]